MTFFYLIVVIQLHRAEYCASDTWDLDDVPIMLQDEVIRIDRRTQECYRFKSSRNLPSTSHNSEVVRSVNILKHLMQPKKLEDGLLAKVRAARDIVDIIELAPWFTDNSSCHRLR